MIARRPVMAYRVIDEDELLGGTMLAADESPTAGGTRDLEPRATTTVASRRGWIGADRHVIPWLLALAAGAAVAVVLIFGARPPATTRQPGPSVAVRAAAAPPRTRGVAAPRRRLRFGPAWWAIAAAIVLAFTWSTFFRQPAQAGSLGEFAGFAIDDLRNGHHGGHGAALSALQAMLANPSTHLARGLPVDFAQLKNSGCRTLTFAGCDVLEICFQRAGIEFHCYILPRAGPGAAGTPYHLASNGMNAIAWNDSHYTYAVVGTAGAEAINRLL